MIEALFGPSDEWNASKAAWDAAHGHADGGSVEGFRHLPSHKHVPSHQSGFTRLQSSVPGPDMADGGAVPAPLTLEELRAQLAAVERSGYYPWNWSDAARDKLAQQRQALRQRIAGAMPIEVSSTWNNRPGYASGGGISPDVVRAVMMTESGGNPKAVSPKGALGLMQLMPATARDLGVDPLDPEQALAGGRKYLEQMLSMFGNLPAALAAYNMGPGALKKRGMNDLPQETKAYVAKVLARLGKAEQKEPDTLVSQPHNAASPDAPPEPVGGIGSEAAVPAEDAALSEGAAMPMMAAGMGRAAPRLSAPPAIGDGSSPVAKVAELLRDPMSLSRG